MSKKHKNKRKTNVQAGEIRFNKARSGHPAAITKVWTSSRKSNQTQKNNNKSPIKRFAEFIGLSTKTKRNNEGNIKLNKNPKPNCQDEAYIRPYVDKVEVNNATFSKPLPWKFDKSDSRKIKKALSKEKTEQHITQSKKQ